MAFTLPKEVGHIQSNPPIFFAVFVEIKTQLAMVGGVRNAHCRLSMLCADKANMGLAGGCEAF